jgi:hypothetical protein
MGAGGESTLEAGDLLTIFDGIPVVYGRHLVCRNSKTDVDGLGWNSAFG